MSSTHLIHDLLPNTDEPYKFSLSQIHWIPRALRQRFDLDVVLRSHAFVRRFS
jgi:hypothetical protein